jgi:hypothetical protein
MAGPVGLDHGTKETSSSRAIGTAIAAGLIMIIVGIAIATAIMATTEIADSGKIYRMRVKTSVRDAI